MLEVQAIYLDLLGLLSIFLINKEMIFPIITFLLAIIIYAGCAFAMYKHFSDKI